MEISFYLPTQVRMGRDIVERSAQALAGLGKRAMLVTGRSSAVKCGAQADVTAVLERNGQTWVVFDQVMSNPTVDCVYAGAELARREGVDFLIAIGGSGSIYDVLWLQDDDHVVGVHLGEVFGSSAPAQCLSILSCV